MSTKKRSRSTSEAAEKPSKTRKVTLEVCPGPTTLTASFMRGFPPQAIFGEDDLEITHRLPGVNQIVAKQLDAKNIPHALEIVSNESKLTYTGKSADITAPQYYIGVYDKETNKVKIVPTKFFTLDQTYHGPKTRDAAIQTVSSGQVTREDLVATFSGQKAHRKFKQLRDNMTPMARIEGLNLEIESEQQAHDDLPPFDTSATDPANIYDIDHICGEAAKMEPHISEWRKAVKKDTSISKLELHGLVEDAMQLLCGAGLNDEALDESIAKCRYLDFLITFYQLLKKTKRVNISKPIPDIPSTIAEELANRFASRMKGSSFEMTGLLFKKLVHYILVLALYLTNSQIDAAKISKDLLLLPRDVTTHLQGVGCKIRKKKETDPDSDEVTERTFGVLKAPLVLSQTNRLHKKKRK